MEPRLRGLIFFAVLGGMVSCGGCDSEGEDNGDAGPECQVDEDCKYDPPMGFCEDFGSHWECVDQVCHPVCNAEYGSCYVPADCTDPLPEGCEEVGHWDCRLQMCQPIGCPQYGTCTEASDCLSPWPVPCLGLWTCRDGICDPECGYGPCATEQDCVADFPSTMVCLGHFECERETCQPECGFGLCETVNDCVRPWTVDCQGHYECIDAICEAVCD